MPSILHILKSRSLHTPNQKVFTFLEAGESAGESLTFEELQRKAHQLSTGILKFSSKGDRVLLLLPQGIDFIVAFYACMICGVIAVPCSIPTKRERLNRTKSIIDNASPTLVIGTPQLINRNIPEAGIFDQANCHWVTLDQLDSDNLLPEDFQNPNDDTIAYLQYTSGSTGNPKGTIITHENIVHNLASFQDAFQHDHDTVCVSWLPFFHDMGLVYGLMQPVFNGYHCFVMSPLSFMQNPICWLRAISDFKATHTVAPNFGYELCASIPESQKEGLDLSSWKVAINGSEFIRSATLKKFTNAYKGYGWDEKSFCPGYGLAEATLMVTALSIGIAPRILEFDFQNGANLPEGIENQKQVVGCGYLNSFTEVKIVHPATSALCKDGDVGEIWLAGKNIAPGYWNNDQETTATFRAMIKGSKQPYLRTGDLGFILDQQLFVVGRIKELIILNGQNFYPTDLEQLAESCDDAIKDSGVCAFSFSDGIQEKVVLVCEIKRSSIKELPSKEVAKKIISRLIEELGVRVSAVCFLPPLALPRTTSGKIQRLTCKSKFLNKTLSPFFEWEEKPMEEEKPLSSSGISEAEHESVRNWLIGQVAEVCAVDSSEIKTDEPLSFYGLDSNLATRLALRVNTHLHKVVSPTLFYNFPTIDELAEAISNFSEKPDQRQLPFSTPDTLEPVAIIGMGCRFPGAANLEEFWQFLESGGCAITSYPEARWGASTEHIRKEHPSVNYGGMLSDIDQFDPAFFGITPREAIQMDPQQRLLLEVVWESLQDAGIRPASLQKTKTGVYVGISANEYAGYSVNESASAHAITGIALSIAASRISYLLDLKGPALAIDTACSSSLVALHRAVKDLQYGEIDLAIIGGVNLLLNPIVSVIFDKAGMLSTTGRCKTFDANADGYVRSEGCGVIILKRKAEAIADHNHIRAVVRGSAINQDGKSNGITAPNGRSQVEVIRQALHAAQISENDISFFEAHGTGTPLGDPIEVNALKEVLVRRKPEAGECWLSSVKANIGHLEAAAGVAGLIKAVLCLSKRTIPAQVNYTALNPEINLADGTSLNIPVTLTRLPAEKPLFAGVSSFGFGGTNAHVILENAPEAPIETIGDDRHELVLISARTKTALRELARRYYTQADRLTATGMIRLGYSSLFGRDLSKYTIGIVARDPETFKVALRNYPDLPEGTTFTVNQDTHSKQRVAWVFTGQGSQYAGMGKRLYQLEPVFKAAIDDCAQILQQFSFDLPAVLFRELTDTIHETQHAQPAIFSIEYGLARLLQHWGLKPDVLIGHSIGEYVAACISGILTLHDALKMISLRASLMQQMPSGGMAVVFAHESRLASILPSISDHVSIAAYNTPNSIVVSGEKDALGTVYTFCSDHQIPCKPLTVSHAFHSPMTTSIQQAFEEGIGNTRFSPAGIPVISTMTGMEVEAEMGTPAYWTQHIRKPVLFREGIKLAARNHQLFIEIGPKAQLQSLILENAPEALVYPTITGKGEDDRDLCLLAGRLYAHKLAINWQAVFGKRLPINQVILPLQPYDKESFWIQSAAQVEHPSLAVRHEPPGVSELKPRFDIAALSTLISEVLHIPADRIDPHTALTSLGADSIMLLELIKKIKSKFQVDITIRQLFAELSSLHTLANYIQEETPSVETAMPVTGSFAAPAVNSINPIVGSSGATGMGTPDASLNALFQKQLDLVNQTLQKQFELLARPGQDQPDPNPQKKPTISLLGQLDPKLSVTNAKLNEDRELTPRQQIYFNALLHRYTQKTGSSKRHAALAKTSHADWLYSIDFRLATKEFLYPIISKAAYDARFVDIDDNEYIDLGMGYGVNFFGNNPAFIKRAIADQLEQGQEIATQNLLATQIAHKICGLTGQERLTYLNSGTEAVMTAIRIARTVTQKNKIVIFNGYYHGTYDGNLAQADPDSDGAMPSSTGIPQSLIHDVVLLNYGQASAIAKIRQMASEIAAVIIEPVQSRKPEGFDQLFLQELRTVTEAHNIALVFDEIITGFRVHAGGMRAITGIQADLTTYGKVIGGGMPIGLVAGSARFMDAIDGGPWNYGDDSFPKSVKTFFGGTFCKHPLTLAAMNAAADKLIEEGPALHEKVNALAARIQEELNDFFRSTGIPMKIVRYASLFRFISEGSYNMLFRPIEMDIFFYSLMEKGIFTWERRICFLSTAHTTDEVVTIIEKVRETVYEMLEGGFFPEANPLKVPGISKKLPLTAIQKQLYLLSTLNEGASVASQLRMTLKCTGPLDAGLMERAVQRLVDRHEALRIKFAPNGEYQEILSALRTPFEVLEMPADAPDPQQYLQKFLIREADDAFDLHKGPLFRVRLLKMSPQLAYLSITAHHLVADGWSMGIIAKDLGDLYSNLLHPDSHPLIEPLPFSAYLQQLQSPEQVKKINTQKGYWQNKLDGKVPTRLPFIKNKGRSLDYSGNRIRKRLPASLLAALRTMSNEQGATLFMSLYAVFSALLHKLTDNPELFIGVPSAGRSFGTDQFMVGSCADTIVIAHEVNPDRPFNQYLNQAKALLTEAYEYQDCTFSYVKDDLHLKGSNNIRIVFNLDSHVQLPGFYGIEAELAYSPIRHAQFDLLFDLSLVGQDIQIECDYSTDLFEEADIHHFIVLFENTLQAVVAQPAMRISDISVMGVNELDLLLRKFNQTKTPIDLKLPIHDRFEGTARQFPNHIALAFDSRKITYADLDKQANRLANHLIESYGLQKGSLIAVLEDHSIEQTIALLAILKAGGVYVPVDPGFDSNIIQTILKEAGILCVLLNSHFADRLSKNSSIARLLLDQQLQLPVASDRKPGISFSEDDTACLIFSSEHSNGISIGHAGLINAVLDQMAHTGIKERDTFLQVLSVADGNSILNSFSVLLSGATLHTITSHFAMDAARLHGYIDQHQITAFGTTPSYLRLLLQDSSLPSVLKIISSGEALRLQDVQRFQGITHKLLFNKYGSPEVAISAALHKVTTRDLEAGIIPIGGPGANKQFYVLNEAGELQPIGIPGELAIGGLGIASTYLNNPRLTSEKFIYLPFVPEEKLFLTGDMAKWLPDGRLVFTGKKADWHRIDSQLVNLFEIEAHLLEHPLVEDAQVVCDTSEGGGHLVAFVRETRHKIQNGKEKLSPESLKSFLHKSLPGYMVPKQVVVVETIPLTLKFKSDRKKLRAIAGDHVSAASSVFRTAGSLTESVILDIWKEVLEMNQISLDANYFEIGGQSLKGMQIGFRIKEKFGLPITLKEFMEYPTISAMAEWVDRAINKPVVPVQLQPESHYYPVSLTQKRLWTLIQIEGAHHNYNLFGAFSVEGDLNKYALEQTIKALVQRHEILRTTFELQEDELVQKVHSFESFNLEIAHHELGSEEEQQTLEILRREELHQFDIAQGPLLKVGLIKNTDQKHILYLNLHHIIADGWSLEVIKSELNQLYSAYVAGRGNTLAPLVLQYRHYAQRQIERLKSGSLASARQYWLNKFQPVPPRLNLPIDAPARPSVKAYQGARERRLLTHAVSSAIYELGKANQATPFMILISGVSALLNRYTHAKQMVLGTSVLGRNERDLENQIGFYINLLALGIDVDDQKGFNNLLDSTRTTLLDALAHQDYPFDMLADDLEIERDLSFAPLFDVYVSINDNLESNFTLDQLVVKPLKTQLTSSKYDLSFNFEESPGAIELEIEYDTKLFSQDKIIAILEHFERLLACCLADVEAPLRSHDYVSAEEKQTLLETFHGGSAQIPAAASIPALFKKAVQENWDRTALIDGAVCLSYGKFDQMTNQFARYLMEEAGVVTGDRIIIMTAPGHQMVLGLFSILKAGAVYVPVDPSYPADRIAQIYEACTPRTILTDAPDYKNLEGLSSLQIPSHWDWGMIGKYSLEKLPLTVSGEDLAYIIYTSGSTGTPKGVMIRHKSVYNTINWMWEALQFDKSDIVLQKTSFTFDVSVWEFFMTLCYGARLVCCPKEMSYDMELLHNYIGEQEITSLSFVPSALVVYQDYLSRQKEKIESPLKRIIAAGEALKPQTVKAHYQLFSNTLYNLYGPTEATIYVSYYEPTALDEIIPIGKPIFNTSLLVLDNYRQLCPVGIPGEIAIGGIGLAEGYYHNQALTDKAFVDHPYRKGEKLYLTGDIGKMLKDGNIAYLGRKDNQIKLRGFRIELGEIETIISRHEQVNEAVVLLSEGASPFLVAYVSLKYPVTASELKTYLNGKLPSYMVPSAFIFMDQFPINSNGKIDRKALLKTDAAKVSQTGNPVVLQEAPSAGNGNTNNGAFNGTKPIEGLPSNNLELQMLLVWEKVLHSRIEDIRSLQAVSQLENGQQHISVTDNFFKIGGDSYLAVKLSTLIKKELKLNIEVRHLFEYPSIRALCEFAGERIFEYAPIPLQESRPFYQASPAQRRFFLMQELSMDKARFNLYASLWLRGPLEVEALQQALAVLIDRHESLRTSFLEVDGEIKQLVHPIDVLPSAFVYEDFCAHPDAEKEALKAMKINGIHAFDLSEAPLIHLHIIKVAAEKHILIVNIHHIICDEWSLEVFVGELKSIYQATLRGLPASLKPLPAQYKDFVVWLEEALNFEREKLRAYWLELFAKGVPQLMLPLDFPRPANRSSEGTEFREKIPARRLEQISRILEKEDATFNMFFTAAVTFFLHKITGQEDIVIGTPVSGRIHPDMEHQIGLFINTLTLYSKVNPDASFAVLLQSVRQHTLQAQEHQLYPFDELVNDLLETREEGRNPLFDVWMVYHNAAVSERGFDRLNDEVTMSPIEDGVVLSRYDLKFDFIKTPTEVDLLFESSNDLFTLDTSLKLFQAFKASLNFFIDHFQERPSDYLTEFLVVPVGAFDAGDPAPIKKIEKRSRKQ